MDRIERRLLVFAVSSLAFFLGVELGGFNLVLLRVAQSFELNTGMMGILVTSQYIAITLAPIAFGGIADRIGKKITLLMFMPLFAAGCFLTASSGSVLFFVTGVFIIGIGYSVCESVSSSALSDTFPGRENRYMNIMQSTFSLGAVVSPLFFGWLLDRFNYSWSLVFIVPGCGFMLVYPLMFLSGCRRVAPGNPGEKKTNSMLSILRSSFFIALFFCMLAYVAMETGISYFIDSLLVHEYQNSALGAWTISGFWFAMAFSRIVFASIRMKPRTMVLLGFSTSAILLFILFLFRNQWMFFGSVLCLGFMMGPVWGMVLSTGMSAFQEKSGAVGGILYAGGGFGGIITPVIFGAVAEKAGFYTGFLLLAFTAAAGFVAMKCRGRNKG
ncbi:MAG: MFS transporter [Treponema sp.]|jgi:fucose permease|nr:MFS transporter [Treponema sp.]